MLFHGVTRSVSLSYLDQKEKSVYHKFKLLLWKNNRHRFQHILLTFSQIGFPIGLCFLVSLVGIGYKNSLQLYYADANLTVNSTAQNLKHDRVRYEATSHTLLPLVIVVSSLFYPFTLIEPLVVERIRGIKNILCMRGVNGILQGIAWFFHELPMTLINIGTFVFFFTFPITSNGSILSHSNVFIVFFTIFLHGLTTLFFCFVIASCVKSEKCVFSFWFLISIITLIIPMALDEETFSDDEPHFKINAIIQLIGSFFFPNVGLYLALHVIITFETRNIGMQWKYLNTTELSFLSVSVPLFHIWILWITAIVFYSFLIWYFNHIFPGRFRKPKSPLFLFHISFWDDRLSQERLQQAEQVTSKNKTLISICNVSASHDDQLVLEDVSLDINYGEILTIYGLTKSGKSSLLSLINGFEVPESGVISVKGKDISCIQHYIGFCPQYDMLFEFLTVKEHLKFYGRLAGRTEIELQTEIRLILSGLHLQSQQAWFRRWMSKGLRRRLSVGIALIGNNGVIILDEPTLDMEEEVRRSVWSLINEYRRRRCVLVASKSVRECLELGRTIAILCMGKIKAQGSVEILGKQVGAGYILALKTAKNADIAPIIHLIRKYIDSVKMENHEEDKLDFWVPIESKEIFPDMIFELERKKPDLLVHNIDVFVTSIEHAMTSFAEPYDAIRRFGINKFGVLRLDRVNEYGILKLTQQQTRQYRPLLTQQILGLMLKKCCYTYHRWQLLFPQLILPVLLIAFMLYVNNNGTNLIFLLHLFAMTQLDYEALTLSSTNETSVKTHQFHSLHAVHFLMIVKYVLLSLFLPLAFTLVHCSFCVFLIEERITHAKNIQLMSGVRKSLFWTVTLIWDYVAFTLLIYVILFIILTADESGILSGSDLIGILIVVLFLSGWAVIPFSYALAFSSRLPCPFFLQLITFNVIIGIVLPLFILISSVVESPTFSVISWILQWIFRLIPHYPFTMAIIHLVKVTINICSQFEPQVLSRICKTSPLPLEIKNCCNGGLTSFQQLQNLGIIEELLSMVFCGILYLLCLWLYERENKLRKLHYNIRSRVQEPIDSEIQNIPVFSDRALCVDRLTRRRGYVELISNVTFHVNCGDCVGLVGPSTATKSTLLRICVGKEEMDSGEITLYDANLTHHRRQYLTQVGYCPPSPALFGYLTVKETLIIHAMLNGLISVGEAVNTFISVFDLENECDKITKNIRENSRQKLSVALSLIGNPPVLFLDQPTSGLDFPSVVQIWKVLKAFTKTDTTIILAPSSLQENLILCSRVGILSGGRLLHYGKLEEIRGDFGDGVTITLALEPSERSNFEEIISHFDQFMDAKFDGCIMTRLHNDELCYCLPNYRINWPYLFEMMEEAKEIFHLKNYSIDRTNLNELVFLLSFRP